MKEVGYHPDPTSGPSPTPEKKMDHRVKQKVTTNTEEIITDRKDRKDQDKKNKKKKFFQHGTQSISMYHTCI